MFSTAMAITPQDVRTQSPERNGIALGQLGATSDGKLYRYGLAGGANLSHGKLAVNADIDANVANKTIAATASAGVLSVVIDAAGAITANAYRGGYLTINDATGEGYNYLVVGNTATTGAAELTVTLAEPLVAAVTVDVSEATLTKHPYDSVVISATDQLDMPVGVPNIDVTAAYYAWFQVGGKCSVLADASTHARGSLATISAATAGAIGLKDGHAEVQVGIYDELPVSTEYQSIYLTIN